MARCDAVRGGRRNGHFVGPRALGRLGQCTKDGVVSYPDGPVCRIHHNKGFVSWSQTVGAVSPVVDMATRAAAVMEMDAHGL